MKTKALMTITSLVLALAGFFALFLPDVLLSILNITATDQLSALVQIMGAMYFGFAFMNWTAKGSAIGGIYARPMSIANFSHFFIGSMSLLRYIFKEFSLPVLVITIIYLAFAAAFYWLTFRATGLDGKFLEL